MPRARAAAHLTTALVAAGLTLGGTVPATGRPPGWTDDPARSASLRTVTVGDDQVRLVESAHGRTLVEPLPRRDGTSPSLVLASGASGTTLREPGEPVPTLLEGSRPPATASTGSEDLVELRFAAVDRYGRPAPADIAVFEVERGAVDASRWLPADTDECTTEAWAASTCLLVPPGNYAVMALVTTNPADQPSTASGFAAQSVALVGEPEVRITRDRTFTFDARRARHVRVRTPGRPTSVVPGGALELGFSRTARNGRTASRTALPASLLDEAFYVQPTARVRAGYFRTLARLRLEAPDITFSSRRLRGAVVPEYYDAHWFSDVSAQWPVWDGRARLRVVPVGDLAPRRIARLDLRRSIAVVRRSDVHGVAALSNAAAAAGARLVAVANDGPGDNSEPGADPQRLRVPTVRLSRAEGRALRRLPRGARVVVRGESASPYVYDLVIKEEGEVPARPTYTYSRDELATQVRSFHGQPSLARTASEAAYHYQPGDTFSISRTFPLRQPVRTRTEYRIPDRRTRWTYGVSFPEFPYNHQFPGPPVTHLQLGSTGTEHYRSGERVEHHYGTGPLVASLDEPVERSGDLVRVDLHGLVDGAGNVGPAYSDETTGYATLLTVLADGREVGGTTADPSGIAAVPTDTATVEIVFRTENPQSWAELATRTETRWTFPTAPVPDDRVRREPVLVADYDVPVDLRNRLTAPPRGRAAFTIALGHHASRSGPAIDRVSVEASYDGGMTWRPASVGPEVSGRRRVELPRGTGLVSLRLHAADTGGSTLEQVVVDAFAVR